MPQGDETSDNASKSWRLVPRRRRSRIGLAVLIGALFGVILAWTQRESFADNIISDQLAALGLDADYEIISIGPRRQIIRNVIVGDAAEPDLEIEEVEVRIAYGFGLPGIAGLKLTRPRIFGHYDEQAGLSFGELDTVIFAESDEPAALPDFNLEIIEGEAVLSTGLGKGALELSGDGKLSDGFEAKLAGKLPPLAIGGCKASSASLSGIISVADRQPRFDGPLNLTGIECEDTDGKVAEATIGLALSGDRDLSGFSGEVSVDASNLSQGGFNFAKAGGKVELEQREGILVAKFDLTGDQLAATQFSAAAIGLNGEVRVQEETDRIEIRGRLTSKEIQPGANLIGSIDSASEASGNTLAEPILAKFSTAFSLEASGSTLTADFLLRESDGLRALIIPEAIWKGASGQNLLSVSQVQFATDASNLSKISGNFISGGKDLPRMSGRMEQAPSGKSVLRLRMDPYSAGDASISAPDFAIAQSENGGIGLSGRLIVSGDIPGGSVRQLAIPLRGGWREGGNGWLWRSCAKASFGELTLASIALEDQQLEFCPQNNRPIVTFARGGARFQTAIPQQRWQGRFDGDEAQIELLAAEISSDEGFSANQLEFVSGAGEEVTRFAFTSLEGKFGETVEGSFSGGEFALGPVPFEFSQGTGKWEYAEGVLSLGESSLLMDDRQRPNRFNTMLARDFALKFEDGVIRTDGTLRNVESGRGVTDVAIVHELASGNGYAELSVTGLTFDEGLQPEQLSDLALGIIALADGTLTGEGRIDWKDGEIVSSGEVRTDEFDFAAEFGPVEGVSGTVRFTDLISLTTEPNQRLKIASMNPGIEVMDGEMLIEMREGQIISIKGGVWPFLGGTLTLRPVDLNIGIPEERRYIIEIEGADAAQFIATMEMTNLSASGIFDGTLPIVFDEFGNGRIEDGLLISRPPGGNLSYVGELTYEDLSAIGNFAFGSLRSLDYNQMQVEMNGPLIGEIVTRLQFDGIRQGETASRNFVTKQIAKLPIQFRVNIRAPFYQLLTSFESMYDPSFLRDPRDLGLLYSDGTRFVRPEEGENVTTDEPPIQRQESELVP